MGGMIELPLNQTGTVTTGCTSDYWPTTWPNTSAFYYHTIEPPRECSGEVHVFPCPHCEKCKCGKATVKRGKPK